MKPTKVLFKNVLELVEGEGRRKTGPVVGVDVHKEVLAFYIVDAQRILTEGSVPNTTEGITNFIETCTRLHVKSVAFESTSIYHWKLTFALLDAKVPLLLANPVQTATTQEKKTDKLDARRIALAHRDDRLKPSVMSPRDIAELRTCTRNIQRLICEQTKSKQRLNQLLHTLDCTLQSTFPNLFKSTWLLELLQAVLDEPDKMIEELVEKYY